uniref:Uncharacterized protein n=1 Tax=Alexandrium monilatum TaxID=311494 RepID=A0A7S4QAQ6_9DINO|mmetsp:Transcript_60687/g.180751  ORF Transcript_60687/g.180751 Transcript_60687/m.180751 type:complete len:206 (+) Transcript_60687:83-700(+)
MAQPAACHRAPGAARRRRAPRLAVVALAAAALAAAGLPLLRARVSNVAWVPGPAEGRRSLLAAVPGVLLASRASPSQAAGFFSTDRFDGTYRDPNHPCDECLVNINAEGGFATITGKDGPEDEAWDLVATYAEKDIVADFSPKGGPKKVKGKYFSKKGDKGIQWEDGQEWEKLEYKVNAAPYEIVEKGGMMRQKQLEAGEIKSRR